MSDMVAVGLPRWLLGFGALVIFGGCGGTVLEHNGPGSDGGATSTGGRTGTGSAAVGGEAGAVLISGGKPGAGGKSTTIHPPSTGAAPGTGAGGNTFVEPACRAPLTACPDGCFDTRSDANHCGSCYGACPFGDKCVNSICQGASAQTCAAGTVFCSNFGECLDTKSNPFACGSCNTPCNGTRCNDGVCDPKSCISPTATYCPANGGCSETSRDPLNCGACGNACGPADSCQNGKCVPPDCGPGSQYCRSSGCTDTTSDTRNCGACDKSCFPGTIFDESAYSCDNGTCGCQFNANKCGKACASAFWYCPADSLAVPLDVCLQTARNGYETCACNVCLSEVQACFTSPSCINSMDCTLGNPCPTCTPVFSSCTDEQMGTVDPLAAKLVQCMNSQCSKPTQLPGAGASGQK